MVAPIRKRHPAYHVLTNLSSSRFLSPVGFLLALAILVFHATTTRIDSSFDGGNIVLVGDTILRSTNTTAPVSESRSSGENPSSLLADKPVFVPERTKWKASFDTEYEVCFVTSVYSASTKNSDRPPDVNEIRSANPTFRFFAFSNLSGLDAPGWTIIHKNFTNYRRFITQSRWAKFMGWQNPEVHKCQAVFYMDGFCGPKLKHSERYKNLSLAIHESDCGLFQNPHEVAKGPLHELDRVLVRDKDIEKNVRATKAYLLAQPDFRPEAQLYANHYIGYDPKNPKFQEAASFFWEVYSREEGSWRDQPLWGYVLDHFRIKPARLGTFKALFKEYFKRMGHAGHRYNEKADANALT